jgi:hypothetical protein
MTGSQSDMQRERRKLSASAIDEETERRQQLRVLDACLYELENAHESNEKMVGADLVGRLLAVPAIRAGMRITDAIAHVMRAQERYLLRPEHEDSGSAGGPALTQMEARAITARIRTGAQQMCLLLLEAYERRAAIALGYATWQRYVKEEFGLSRSRSYELLDLARVMRALGDAAGMTGTPDISPYAARQIKAHLDDVVTIVRDRAADARPEALEEIVRRSVDETRARIQRDLGPEPAPEAMPAQPHRLTVLAPLADDSLSYIREAIDRLASLPAAADLVEQLDTEQLYDWSNVAKARRWLDDLTRCLDQRWPLVSRAGCG